MNKPAKEVEPFVLPDYLEPWREEIEAECGGPSAEDLMNDKTANGFNNPIRAALCAMCDTKIRLLARLHKRGHLILDPKAERERWEKETTAKLAFIRGHLEGYATALALGHTIDREALVSALEEDADALGAIFDKGET